MKLIKNIPICFLAMLLCLGIMRVPVYAATSSQDGLEVTLTTDKKSYNKGDQIVATLMVTNKNDVAVDNVILENLIPDNYKLAEGSIGEKQIESLAAGEKVSITVTYVDKKSNDNSVHKPRTGDDSNIFFWCMIIIVAGIVIIVSKKKSGKKVLSLFLGLTIVGTVAIGESASAKASNFKSESISISESITVGNSDLIIWASVKYEVDTEQDNELIRPTKPENPSEAEEYYWDNSEVLKIVDAKESKDVLNETEVISVLKERGFVDYPVTYDYSIEGKYHDETEVLEKSTNRHPMYQTYYQTKKGEVWTIFVINGDVFANPASFNLESELEAQLLFSENEELTSYDYESNKFYITIPQESAAIVKVIKRIDAETLDKLTIEEIKNYEK